MIKNKIERIQKFLGMNEDVLTVKNITRIALLVAIAIVLKAYLSIETGIWRLTFYEIPLVVLGVFFGPMFAIIGGLATDFAYIMSRGWMYAFNIFTISTIMWALIPAFFFYKRRYTMARLITVVLFTSTLVFILNTIGLVQFFGSTQLVFLKGWVPGPMLPRVVTYLIKLPVQVYLVHVLVSRLVVAFEDLELVK